MTLRQGMPRAVSRTCRALAVAMSVMGVIDPSWVRESASAPIDVVIASTRGDRAAAPGTAASGGQLRLSAQDLVDHLGADRVRVHQVGGARLVPCAVETQCVVLTDGTTRLEWPRDRVGPVSLVRLEQTDAPNVQIAGVSSDASVRAGAQGVIEVTLRATGLAGSRTRVRVQDEDAVVGEGAHEWKADGSAAVSIPWWPVAEGARLLKVGAEPAPAERAVVDNTIDLSVNVTAGDRLPVLVYEPRPSWAATFVRRAIERDPRLTVHARVRLGHTLVAGHATGGLDEASLQEAHAAVIGAPDALEPVEVDLLDRYVRVRGGSLVLLPDRALGSVVARLVSGTWREHVRPDAELVGALRASEFLALQQPGQFDRVLAGSAEGAIVASSPAGAGRVIVSGALDAWRYRASSDDFDRFWQALVADAAAAGGPSFRVAVDRPLVEPGETVAIAVEHRTLVGGAGTTARATLHCEGGRESPLRLWPARAPGAFTARVRVSEPGTCRVAASAGEAPPAAAVFRVAPRPARSIAASFDELEDRVRFTGGWSVHAGQEAELAEHLRRATPDRAELVTVYPMRSPWWMLPLAACLGIEWWDRRRRGLP
jgi:hypothetical protein